MPKQKSMVYNQLLLCFALFSLSINSCATTSPGKAFKAASIKSIEIYTINYKPGFYSSYIKKIEESAKKAVNSKGYNATLGSHINKTFHTASQFYKYMKPKSSSDAILIIDISELKTYRVADKYGHNNENLSCMQFMYWLYENKTSKRILIGDPFKGSKPVCRFPDHLKPGWVFTFSDDSGKKIQSYSYDVTSGMFIAENKIDYEWEKMKEREFIYNYINNLLNNLPHTNY